MIFRRLPRCLFSRCRRHILRLDYVATRRYAYIPARRYRHIASDYRARLPRFRHRLS